MGTKNESLVWLEQLKLRAQELRAEEASLIDKIRTGFVDQAIVFMDVVGSTLYKVEHKERPEQWILRVRQFSELLAAAVTNANGRVVKFIGDEVMAAFDNIRDAQNLIGRIDEIENNLKEATGTETRIKVAVDYGPVYFLEFDGHGEPDPQGTPVDRCARIAKFGQPGRVVASEDFATKTPLLTWKKLGATELKGLGRQSIYQLGGATIDISPKVEVPESEYENLREELGELKMAI